MKNTASPSKILAALLAVMLLIHAACALPFYALISHELETGEELVPNLYIISRLFRFALCLAIAFLVRRRYREVLTGGGVKRVFTIALAALFCCTVLYLCGYGDDFYHFLSFKAGVFHTANTPPMFLVVLWEQVVSIDLLFSALLGSLIMTLPARPRPQAA